MESRSPIDGIPPAHGKRISWGDVPQKVRSAIEKHLGSFVVKSLTQYEGFSPGLAAKLVLSNKETVFAKAVSSVQNEMSPVIHRREIKIATSLPSGQTEFPKLLWTYDDGEWVVLLFENIEGTTPSMPWSRRELKRVLSAVNSLSDSLTPSPIQTISTAKEFGKDFTSWRRFAEWGTKGSPKVLDKWCVKNIDRLANLEAGWEEASKGNTLVHADIRADNILLTKDRVVFVDWPWACQGAKWIDLLFFLPSVAMQGGPKPWEIFDSHPLGAEADQGKATRVLAALAGLFIRRGNQPPEKGLPYLREFQLGQAKASLEWLKVRTGW